MICFGKCKTYTLYSDRIRLANFLAPVASEANMSGPLGWIADSWIEGIMEVYSVTIWLVLY